MKSEKSLRRWFLTISVLMSASILYGGYQVHKEADRQSTYQESVRQRAVEINSTLCSEIDRGAESAVPQNPIRFLRVCAEGL